MVTYLLVMKITHQPMKPSDNKKEKVEDNFLERSKLITNELDDYLNDGGITSSNLLSSHDSSK